MFRKHRIPIIGVAVIAVLYLLLFSFSARGWGYPGYHGYLAGPSFFYWGGARYYYPGSPSARAGSMGGTGRTGGISGGK